MLQLVEILSKSLNLLLSLPTQAASQTRITAGMKALVALEEQQPNVYNVLPHEEGREQAGQELSTSSFSRKPFFKRAECSSILQPPGFTLLVLGSMTTFELLLRQMIVIKAN
ncbi:hypothetical protein Nmel_001005 [Mimus melanotis]